MPAARPIAKWHRRADARVVAVVWLEVGQMCYRRAHRAHGYTKFIEVHGGQNIGQPREYQSG